MWDQLRKDKQKLTKINETAFSMIDLNGDGKIERSQLQHILMMTAEEMNIERPTKEEVKQIMKTLDIQNKGHLSKQNFLNLVTQVVDLLQLNKQR